MKLLILTTSADTLGPAHPTGLWLEEFAVPYNAFLSAGATILVASPKGGAAPLDPKTAPSEEQRQGWSAALEALATTTPLASLAAEDFDAVFIPGGHGPLVDLAHDLDVARLLTAANRAGKIIGAVCHGPAALLNVENADGKPLIEGKRVTGFTNNEEILVGLNDVVPFLLETALREHGAHFDGTPIPFASHVVRDGTLITGQNPASSAGIAQKMLEALRAADSA